ncbi:MAG: DUF2794 domain-containing protein [Hyphomonadaceae bacterium]
METHLNRFQPPTDMSSASTGGPGRAPRPEIWFSRRELEQILAVYGRLVAQGECRDYAIGAFADHAVFCMHQRASEAPNWTVEKRPELARRQGAYCVMNATGQILKRGQELSQVLKVFDSRRFRVVD